MSLIVEIVENILSPEDFVRLRNTTGFAEIPIEHAKRALEGGGLMFPPCMTESLWVWEGLSEMVPCTGICRKLWFYRSIRSRA